MSVVICLAPSSLLIYLTQLFCSPILSFAYMETVPASQQLLIQARAQPGRVYQTAYPGRIPIEEITREVPSDDASNDLGGRKSRITKE